MVRVRAVRRTRAAVLAATLLAVVALGPGLIAFEALTVAHLEDPLSHAPTRIYARPFILYPGMRRGRSEIERQLRALGYRRAEGRRVEPGEYRLGSRTWIIVRRSFRHNGKLQPSAGVMARLRFGGRIVRLEDDQGRRLQHFTLEPQLIGSFLSESGRDRIPTDLTQIPKELVDAVLTIEDQRFFDHGGLDLRRIAAAAIANYKEGRVVQGGSTLTQQLAKNLYLNPRRTLLRKIREAAIALTLEHRHSKEEILEAYLNEVYLGQDGGVAIHGVARASQHYFGTDISEIDLAEAALLAGLIRGPSLYSPFRRPGAARERRDLVLKQMSRRGVISEDELATAREAPLDMAVTSRPPRSTQYFVDFVGEELRTVNGKLDGLALAAFTTLDLELQRAAEEAVREGLADIEARYEWFADIEEPLQAAVVVLDPQSGDVLAMVGGRDYGESQFNRAVNARRQPGSAFKPVVVLAALSRDQDGGRDAGPFTLASVLEDESFTVETPQGPWEPSNYDERFRGSVSLREALERSLNVPIARLGLAVGPERIVETAERMGIESPLRPYPSLSLGAFEVTPLELTHAYAVLAAAGFRADVRPIFGVLDRDGMVIDRREREGEDAYDPAESYLVTSALRGAVERGTGRGLRAMGYHGDVAAKSGTTDDFRDGWFIGYTPALAVGVWVGFDNGRTIGLPGSRVAMPIFTRFLIAAVGPYGDRGTYGGAEFETPPGLEIVEVEPHTGLRAGPGCRGRRELFLRGTSPEESCSPWWYRHRRERDEPRWSDQMRRWLRRLERDRRSGSDEDRSE